MRVLLFGTYDVRAHPRVATLAEGLRAHGVDVDECNAPLGLDTASRVRMLARPWLVGGLLIRLLRRWLALARATRRTARPDAVLVGYLGHFDVHLARLLFPRTPIVLDHLVGAADTARDRRLAGGPRLFALRLIDAAALRAADVIVVDTEEHRDLLTARQRARALVVPVGAPGAWFGTPEPRPDGPLRVVFFGLYTPLQGTPTIGAALGALAAEPIEVTMIGTGQDEARTKAAAEGNPRVRWLDWVPAEELPGVVRSADVCLGIFGVGAKALRVVPNKVFQGAAAGCAIVTSDTAPQRRVLGAAAVLVPPGDPNALAAALRALAVDRTELARLRRESSTLAEAEFAAARIAAPLVSRLEDRLR
jgi:glycosyltransferase involved in cell wall biosynthesis